MARRRTTNYRRSTARRTTSRRRTKHKLTKREGENIGKAIYWIFFGWWLILLKLLFWDLPSAIIKSSKKKSRPQQTANNTNINNINRIDEVIYNPPQQKAKQSEQLTPKQTLCFLAICAVLLIACVIIGIIIAFNN